MPEGIYHIRAIASDIDGNADPNPIAATLRVDHTGPAVRYDAIAGLFVGFAPSAAYQDDGKPGTSLALVPDPATGDLNFMIATPSTDVHTMTLQWHQDGNQDMGDWDDFGPGAAFDYQPNLDFTYAGTTYQVWWVHVNDFVAYCTAAGISGAMEIRALATDYAGNSNILHDALNPWTLWTVDIDNPMQQSFVNSLTDNQVASGQPVYFTFVGTDSTTDVAVVRFEYALSQAGPWTVIDPNPSTPEIETVPVTGSNIDTPYAAWTASVTWDTPYPVVQDTQFQVRAVFYDTAGNEGISTLQTITVEDDVKPDMTKIWAIPAKVLFVAAMDDSSLIGQRTEPECQPRNGVFIDLDADSVYDDESDIAIDFGADEAGDPVLVDEAVAFGGVGDENATWPRKVDEVVLGGEITPLLARTVTLVARTQNHDTGIYKVEFWAVDHAGVRHLIDADECPPAYDMNNYLWHVTWNTLALDDHGDPLYPDGTYQIVPIATDLEGNVEDWPAGRPQVSTVIVDNTAPTATADADPNTPAVETTITVERNDVLHMFARTTTETEDDVVTFIYKRASGSEHAARRGSWRRPTRVRTPATSTRMRRGPTSSIGT